MKDAIAFEKLEAVIVCSAIKELFGEFQAGAGNLVMKYFNAKPKQTGVISAKTK